MKQFRTVAVGGTFDRLHGGHRALLRAALRATRPQQGKLIVGVCQDGSPMLANKELRQWIEPTDARLAAVSRFLQQEVGAKGSGRGNEEIELSVVPITDAVGPAGEPDVEALVVSADSRAGAAEVNRQRRERGLRPVEVIEIDLVPGNDPAEKLSSTALRRRDAAKLVPDSKL